jgi:ankyrin repeat protein
MNYDDLKKGMEEHLPTPSQKDIWKAIQEKNLGKYTLDQIDGVMSEEDSHRDTLYHKTANSGYLVRIPKELLSTENLLKKGSNTTCLHIAAERGELSHIPEEVLTAKNLLVLNRSGQTCLNIAAANGHIGQIPIECLTAENLLFQADADVGNCIEEAAENGYGYDIFALPLSYETLQELHAHYTDSLKTKTQEAILRLIKIKMEDTGKNAPEAQKQTGLQEAKEFKAQMVQLQNQEGRIAAHEFLMDNAPKLSTDALSALAESQNAYLEKVKKTNPDSTLADLVTAEVNALTKLLGTKGKTNDALKGTEENLPIPSREELWEAIKENNLMKYTITQIEQGMLQGDKYGITLYQDATREGHLDKIPKELLTEETLIKKTSRSTCIHYAAYVGHLHLIPKKLLTEENLLARTKWGDTCLHLAAEAGKLDKIPQELLTEKNLLRENKDGKNCIHLAAESGDLDQIPKEFLNTKTLLQENHLCFAYNKGGENYLHCVARRGLFDKIPEELLTCEHLLKKNASGKTPLDIAASEPLWKTDNGSDWEPAGSHLDKIPLLSLKTLQDLQTHFPKNKYTSMYQNKIRDFLKKQLKEKTKSNPLTTPDIESSM